MMQMEYTEPFISLIFFLYNIQSYIYEYTYIFFVIQPNKVMKFWLTKKNSVCIAPHQNSRDRKFDSL